MAATRLTETEKRELELESRLEASLCKFERDLEAVWRRREAKLDEIMRLIQDLSFSSQGRSTTTAEKHSGSTDHDPLEVAVTPLQKSGEMKKFMSLPHVEGPASGSLESHDGGCNMDVDSEAKVYPIVEVTDDNDKEFTAEEEADTDSTPLSIVLQPEMISYSGKGSWSQENEEDKVVDWEPYVFAAGKEANYYKQLNSFDSMILPISKKLKKSECLPTARENAQLNKLIVSVPTPVYCYFTSKWLLDWDHKPKVKMKCMKAARANMLSNIALSRSIVTTSVRVEATVGLSVYEEGPTCHHLHSTSSMFAGNSSSHILEFWMFINCVGFEATFEWQFAISGCYEEESTDLVKEDFGLAGLMQSEGEKKEMDEALRCFGNRSSDCPMIVRVWQVSVWDGEVKMKHMVVPVDSCRVFKGGGMTRVAYRQVQHGEVISGNLGKQIDLDVESAAMWQLKIFQYRDENLNKTIVHFYVHFGQRFGRFFTSSVYGQFGTPQVRDMSIGFDVGRLSTVTGGLITDEGAGAFSFVDDRKEQGLSLEFLCPIYEIMLTDPIVIAPGQAYDDSNNKQWLDGSCKEGPVTVAEVEDAVVVAATVATGKEIAVVVVVRVGMARVVEKETRIVIVAAADEETAGNNTIHWLYWVPMSTAKMKLLDILANRVFDGGGMDGPFICMLHMGIFCYMLLHTLSVACMSSQSCNDATWHRQVLRRNSRTRSTLDFHCSLRTRNFMGGVLIATNWKMQWESYGESMAVEGEPIMSVNDALAIYEDEFGNSRNFFLHFGVDARAGERLDHGKENGIELEQYTIAFSDYKTCSKAKEFKETERLANARRNAPSRELAAILSVIRNLKGFSVRFPKPMVKMKLVLFSFWELLREADMLGVLRRKVACQGAHAWGLEQGLRVIEFMTFNFSMLAIDHVINSAAKSNYMSSGQISVAIVSEAQMVLLLV